MDWFSDLSTERLTDGGPIPVSKIRKFARFELEMDEELVHLFTTIIREMDLVYLKLLAEQRDKVTRKNNKSSGKRPAKPTRMKTTRTE